MRKDYKPKWSPITEVPVIPVHEDLGGRDAPSQHPIEAIDGLSDVLDAKVDKDATKQLSTEDYTSAEKAKLAGIAAGAEVNAIQTIRINGAEVTPGDQRDVDLAVPTTGDMAASVTIDRYGSIVLEDGDGNVMSTAAANLNAPFVSASCSGGSMTFETQGGDRVTVPMGVTEGAEPNRINGIKIDMVPLNPDSEGTVHLDVYTKLNSVQGAVLDVTTGVVSLTNAGGTAISTMQTPMGESFVSASYDPEHVRLDLVKADGTHAYVDLQALYTPYMSGGGIVITADGPGGRNRINIDAPTDFMIGHSVKDFGDQRIEGAKTFAGDLASTGNPAGLKLQSDKGSYDSGQATVVQHYLATPDGYSLTAYDDVYLQGSRVLRRMKLTGRDGTTHTLALSAGDDGAGYAIAPSYTPQNEGGQYVAPSDGTTVITQGMLAVSPTVVHATGDETIAGSKTFTGGIYGRGAQFDGQFYVSRDINISDTHPKSATSAVISKIMRRVPTAEGSSSYEAVSQNYVVLGADGIEECTVVSGRNGTATMTLVAADDGSAYATAPSFFQSDGHGGIIAPTEGDTIITQSMLAVSPSVVHMAGDEEIAGAKTFTGTLVESGAISSKSVVTPSVQTTGGWYKAYEISVTTNVTHTLVLWSSPTSPVVGESYPMGILMASIRGSSCVLKWHSGMGSATSEDLQKTALVCTQTGEGAYTWALWQKADGNSIGRYLHRMAEYTMNGPSSGWTALAPSASDAQASLPSGEGITVHYSEA